MPDVSVERPAGHVKHTADDTALRKVLYVFRGQASQESEFEISENVPAGHSLHTVAAELLKCPGVHETQSLIDVAPGWDKCLMFQEGMQDTKN